MKKQIVMATLVALALTATSLAAETWSCTYHGSWKTTGTGNSGNLHWVVKWVKKGSVWKIIGDMNDKYGFSYFDGTCQNKSCVIKQTYKTGSLVGKPYTYSGTYSDQNLGPGKTKNTIRGNWVGNNNTGTWSATGTCVKN